MNEKLIRIGITHGDINGVSYELILKAFEDSLLYENCIPVVYGSVKALSHHRKAMDLTPVNLNVIGRIEDAGSNRLNIINVGDEELQIDFGRSTPQSEQYADEAFIRAYSDLQADKIDVLVAAPATADLATYLEKHEAKGAMQLFVNDSFRVGLATGKMPFAQVASALSVELITQRIKDLNHSLVHDFTLTSSRIAVLSLNPGASIKGELGKEEKELIAPAIKAATAAGVYCFGPYAADELFATDEYMKFDAVLAMYYDQGAVAFRSISGNEGTVYCAGLPHVYTAPDQSVSYENAGKNTTSITSFVNAFFLAIDLHKNRAWDSEINAHPLKKQYFERGSDNEKLDLTKD